MSRKFLLFALLKLGLENVAALAQTGGMPPFFGAPDTQKPVPNTGRFEYEKGSPVKKSSKPTPIFIKKPELYIPPNPNIPIEEEHDGLIQIRWPYVFRYEDGKIDERYHSNSLNGITGFTYTKRHPGYDIIVPFRNDLTRPGMASEQVGIFCPFDGVVLSCAFSTKDDDEYHKSVAKTVAEQYGGNWMLFGDTQNWSQGNYIAIKTKEPVKYIRFTRDNSWVKTNRTQGEDVLVVRFLHMQYDRGENAPALPSPGEEITAGTFLGFVGNTGRSNPAHLHIDVNFKGTDSRVLSIPHETIDPRQFFTAFNEPEIFEYNGK